MTTTERIKVGDYDPVTAEGTGLMCPESRNGFECTRPVGHEGLHVACVPGAVVTAFWSCREDCMLRKGHRGACLPHPSGGKARSANDSIPAVTA